MNTEKGMYERVVPLDQYIKKKIKMLERDFGINLTVEELDHFHSLKTHNAVDRYAHNLLKKKL